jgi:hypothetical protein
MNLVEGLAVADALCRATDLPAGGAHVPATAAALRATGEELKAVETKLEALMTKQEALMTKHRAVATKLNELVQALATRVPEILAASTVAPSKRKPGRPREDKWPYIAVRYYSFRVQGVSHAAAVARVQKESPGLSKDTIERSVRGQRDKVLPLLSLVEPVTDEQIGAFSKALAGRTRK